MAKAGILTLKRIS